MPKLNRQALPVTVEHDSPIPMSDGTVLRADVHRPAEGAHPTVLVRTPYDEAGLRGVPVIPALEAGFAVVLQYCRGRGSSDGEFRPWLDEGHDGADTIEWISGRPWSDGQVVMMGYSYLAGCGLQAAATGAPGLKAVVAAMTYADIYEDLNYHGGAFALGSALNWAIIQTLMEHQHSAEAGLDIGEAIGLTLAVATDPAAAQRTLPLRDVPGLFPYWQEWLAHPTHDAYWEELEETLQQDRIHVPVLHVGGWFDLFLSGTLENHRRLREGPAGSAQRLIVGPWSHALSGAAGTGEVHFGLLASAQADGLEARQLGFLRAALDGKVDPGPAVRIFVMGDDVWRDENEWPLERTEYTRYYLREGGGLSPEAPPADAVPSTYAFDPADPVPTVGGPLMLPEGAVNVGPRDQREVERRADVLCFTTPPLDHDLEATGPVWVTLHAATSAADTDWTAKLVDVWPEPDGRAMSVIDGIVRARFNGGATGVAGEFTIGLVATSQVFKAGHRIRVEISSSNFPRFDLNPGTGGSAADTGPADLVIQHQTVFHDAARPSHITLPVIPR